MLRKLRKLSIVIVMAFAMMLAGSTGLMAADVETRAAEPGGFLEFLRNVVGWPIETTQNIGAATGKGLEDTGKGIDEFGAATGRGLDEFGAGTGKFLGDVGEAPGAVVQGTGDAIAQTPEAIAKGTEDVWVGTVDAVDQTGAFIGDAVQAPFTQEE